MSARARRGGAWCALVVLAGLRCVDPGEALAGGTTVTAPTPRAGLTLVASPTLAHPEFARSVVLLLQVDAAGSAGLIFNRPTEGDVGARLPALATVLAGPARRLYYGGPQGGEGLRGVLQSTDLSGARPLREGLAVIADESGLAGLLADVPAGRQLRFFSGYAGWAPGQLECEIARGDWRLVDAAADELFADDGPNLWSSLLAAEPDAQSPPTAPGTYSGAPSVHHCEGHHASRHTMAYTESMHL